MRRRRLFLLLASGVAWIAAGARAQEDQWRRTSSPHFVIAHQADWMPPGFQMSLERMHSRLRMDLGQFSPWMTKEQIRLYLYKDKPSYVGGQFKPESWTEGLALPADKTVLIFDRPDRKELFEILAHETTHMLFRNYWGQAGGGAPPAWLDEGLAMLEENADPGRVEASARYQSLATLTNQNVVPLAQLTGITPTQDLQGKGDQASDWYTQSFGIAYFLFHQHSRLQFKEFAEKLRAGKDVQACLWEVYRYPTIGEFERAWRKWINGLPLRAGLAKLTGEAPGAAKQGALGPPLRGLKALGP